MYKLNHHLGLEFLIMVLILIIHYRQPYLVHSALENFDTEEQV